MAIDDIDTYVAIDSFPLCRRFRNYFHTVLPWEGLPEVKIIFSLIIDFRASRFYFYIDT